MQTKKIFPLSSEVVSKIAAGEVIERPAFAVKELIENAIDAKPQKIEIQIEESGFKKIVVTDNGYGMTKEDLEQSFKLHTTSKISSADELAHISSFGFRGEALSSIAAISNLTLQSRTKEEISGTEITLIQGNVDSIAPVGMPVGTTISVANLFYAIPARKKFLKSAQTEMRHIIETVVSFALAYPQIAFSLTHNQKLLFALPKTEDQLERLKYFLGKETFTNLLPVNYQSNYITISGFIAKPQTASITNKQYLFINKRRVTDRLIAYACKEAYATLLPAQSKPIFVLFLSLPYELVDVNVHPRKEHVRFADTKLLNNAIHQAVSETLLNNNLIYYSDNLADYSQQNEKPFKSTKSYAGKLLKETQISWDARKFNEVLKLADAIQVHNLYLITPTRFGLAFVDQHAAHERILYEQFYDNFKKQKANSEKYNLPTAQLFELSLIEKELLEENLELFKKLGFEIQYFKNTYLINSVPLIFKDRRPQELILEMLDNLQEERNLKDIDKISQKMLAYLACRGAIKAGESLTKKQAKALLEKLQQTSNNTTCPHGRPTQILIDIDDLHRMFKRK
ncbi:DNA mismatch repair endonuclease MutL [Candidatus Roizmanbacteria bacterium]|nr:DNA mismatch repair endonuclease MutL [Candidatus Roizmanbacteria bacterium]